MIKIRWQRMTCRKRGRGGREREREEEESEGREEEKERVMGRGGERFRLLINITYQLVPRPVCLLAVLNCISYKPNESDNQHHLKV